jgi:hypothetical protein
MHSLGPSPRLRNNFAPYKEVLTYEKDGRRERRKEGRKERKKERKNERKKERKKERM